GAKNFTVTEFSSPVAMVYTNATNASAQIRDIATAEICSGIYIASCKASSQVATAVSQIFLSSQNLKR
ncbi:hypothetical protein KIN20_019519, partial [Parelaphostrongylus tenuis]